MIWKTTIFLSCALCVLGDGRQATSEQRVKIHHGHHGDLKHIGSDKPEHHEEYASSYPSYEFSYRVDDPHTHDFKGQEESRDGDEVKGEYWLVEPDGRKRTVKYHADKHSGFHATVHYSDDHHHPGKEEEHEPEPVKEEKKEEEGAPVEEKHDEEEGGEKEESHEEHAAEEGEGKAEETRREQEVGKWIHDRFWGHRDDGRHRDSKPHQLDNRDERHRDEYHFERFHLVRGDGGHKRIEEHKDIGIIQGLGSYGHRIVPARAERHKNDDGLKDEDKEESRPEHRLYQERRVNPIQKTGAIVRENYIHPRFYRHSKFQRSSVIQ